MKVKIQEDIKTAMRAKDQLRLNTVRGLLSEIKNAEINSRQELDSAQCIAIVQKEIKKRRDTIEFAKQGERPEMVAQNESEIMILQSYLGEQLGEAQLKELVTALIAGGADNLGKVMGALNASHKGKFEGKAASVLAKQLLSSGAGSSAA